MGRSGNPAHRGYQSTGIKVEVADRYNRELTDPGPSQHLWTMVGMWQVDPTPRGQVFLDTENLLTIEGPGCFKCEERYSPELAAKPCRGSMR